MSYQSSSSYRVTSTSNQSGSFNQKNIEGEIFDLIGETNATLKWS